MNFAVPYFYSEGGEWMNSAAEIIIDLVEFKTSTEASLVDFIKSHPNQRIIIFAKDTSEFWMYPAYAQLIRKLKDEYNLKNWAICFNETDTDSIQKTEVLLMDSGLIKENDTEIINYFYKSAISSYEQLEWMMEITRVSDIYITSPLIFSIKDLKEVFEKKYLRKPLIRAYPNVCQGLLMRPSIKTFFIRPEDLALYEGYIDIAEIYTSNLEQKKKASVYFDIYNKSKTWMGDLKEYLINCEDSINNLYIIKSFGEQRLNCGRKCSRNKCNRCDNQQEYIRLMEQTQEKMSAIKEGIDTKNEDDVENIREYIGETDKEAEYYEECDTD
jgi:hypothetical protein